MHWASIVPYAEKTMVGFRVKQAHSYYLVQFIPLKIICPHTSDVYVCGQINDVKRVLHLPQFTIYYSPFHKVTLTRIECLSAAKLCNFFD